MDFHNSNISPNFAEKITAIERMFISMRANGSSIRDIAKKLKKSSNTISAWNKRFNHQIVSLRNTEFCELQKKVIESKSFRLDILKGELQKVSALLKNFKFDSLRPGWQYKDILSLFTELSNLMTSCEFDMLTIGVKYKDNIEPETDSTEQFQKSDNDVIDVIKNNNTVSQNTSPQSDDNSIFNLGERQNRNKLLHKIKKKRY